MAMAIQTPATLPAPTRPRLQAINQLYSDLDEQIRHATNLIGLPDGWDTLEGDTRSAVAQRIVRARADWILRWILDKLKDATNSGAEARANIKAWRLLDFAIHVLPVSRCAPHLRDAHFLSILEKALSENFGPHATIQPAQAPHHSHPRDVSDSSETVQEDPQPSRKRKRGSGANTPSKRAAVEASGPVALFDAVRTTVQSIRDKGDVQGTNEEMVHSEHMKMVSRTESAQAARILKLWLNAVQSMLSSSTGGSVFQGSEFLDLSQVVDIWDLRAIDTKDDSGASVEHFSAECLIPILLLSQTLHQMTVDNSEQQHSRKIGDAMLVLDQLLAKQLLVPSRTNYFNAATDNTTKESGSSLEAELLSSSLGTLRAKLLEAAQIEDTGVAIPSDHASLFAAVPHLLYLVIRSSPARTSKARTTERPWIQASLVALAQCVGCSLEQSEFAAPSASVAALERCLLILASHNISIDSPILKKLFWYHSGLKYPLNQKRTVNWSLIAALVEIDPSIFLTEPVSSASTLGGGSHDLASFLFHSISTSFSKDCETEAADKMDLDEQSVPARLSSGQKVLGREDVLDRIVIPIMSAFSHNRQLLRFIERWDDELCKATPAPRESLAPVRPPIWEDRNLIVALADLFEQSLTIAQISTLFQRHAERLAAYTEETHSKSLSSAVLIQAILQSITSDETIQALKPHLVSTWETYASWVQHEGPSQPAALELAWVSLCLLLGILWPIHFHNSASLQKERIRPLLERASKDAVLSRKETSNRHLSSSCRCAAAAFVFTSCDYLRALPGSTSLIQKRLQKTLKALSPGQLAEHELEIMTEMFCAVYVQLLECFESDAVPPVLSGLMKVISTFDEQARDQSTEALFNSVFTHGNASLKTSFASALLDEIEGDSEGSRQIAVCALLQLSPSSLSRDQREAVLDKLLALLTSSPQTATAILSIMVHLMEVPNATCSISSDGGAFFDIARTLHDADMESSSVLQLLQSLVRMTLSHLIPNKDQAQNKLFLETYADKTASCLKKPKKCSPAMFAILTGTMRATNAEDDILPSTQFVEFMAKTLNEGSASSEAVLDAYSRIPLSVLQKSSGIFDKAQASLRKWISSEFSLADIKDISFQTFPEQTWPTIFSIVAKYQLYPDIESLLRMSARLLGQDISEQNKTLIVAAVKETALFLEPAEKLSLVLLCISLAKDQHAAVAYRLLYTVVSTMDGKQEVRPELKIQQLSLLPQIFSLLGNSQDDAAFNILLDSVDIVLRDKPNLTSQHNIECLLAVLLKLATRNSPRISPAHAPAIYARLCETTRLVLLLHRGRLGGRFHLLLPLLQSLLLCLFIPNAGRGAALPPWLDSPSPSTPTKLTPSNASQYTHLLSSLCSPTQSSVQRAHHSRATTLNDPIKAAREYASQYVYPLLSSFCRYQLYGRLDADVREKLMPGVWEVVGLAGALDKSGLDAMFAGLGRSERDVWRGVWGGWVRVFGRRERRGTEGDGG